MRAFRLSQLCLSACDPSGVVVVVMTPCLNASACTPHHCLRACETSILASFCSSVLFFPLPLKRAFSHTCKSIRKKNREIKGRKKKSAKAKWHSPPQNQNSSTSATGLAMIISWETRQSCISVSTCESSFLSDRRQMRLKRMVASYV